MKSTQLENPKASHDFGFQLSRHLKSGMIISLVGELGAGKTSLVQGIIDGLGGSVDEVCSPTFNLVNHYDCEKLSVLHCDFYRLKPSDDLSDFGSLEFFDQEKLYLIEWLDQIELSKKIDQNQVFTVCMDYSGEQRIVRYPDIFDNNKVF